MRQDVTQDIRRIFDDLPALAERLEREGVGLEQESFSEGMAAEEPVLDAARRERDRVLAEGVTALTKVAEGRDETLSDDELLGLEAIVLIEGRPAILVQGGDFGDPPAEWAALGDARAPIREVIQRAGRVEVDGHLDFEWIGTAFLVGERTLMTNRHVAMEFAQQDGAEWTFKRGMTSRLDFREEHGGVEPLEFPITGIIGIHERHDLALLTIDAEGANGTLPDPLAVTAVAPEDLFGRDVYVVGYPAEDGRRNEPTAMRRIFMDLYNVKRLQPGKAIGLVADEAIHHDCSTLGGNSGSPVVDLASHEVIGLHFGGRFGTRNHAVPLWTLTDDELLRAGGVHFQ